jgi:hypothetical protein
MSRSHNKGKRVRIPGLKDDPSILDTVQKRRTWGSTEKILRRNRKLWVRLSAKRRRKIDKEVIENSGA